MTKLYVGNLSYDTTESSLASAFQKYTSFRSAKLVTDKYSGDSKGFAFVELDDSAEAAKAIQEMDGTSLGSRTIKVNEARPEKRDGGPRGGGGGGYRSNFGDRRR